MEVWLAEKNDLTPEQVEVLTRGLARDIRG